MPKQDTEAGRQLAELLADRECAKGIDMLATDLGKRFRVSTATAKEYILSGIGEPSIIHEIHQAFQADLRASRPVRTALLLIRRAALSRALEDQGPRRVRSFHPGDDVALEDPALRLLGPAAYLRDRVDKRLLEALCQFARQGDVAEKQAGLLQRRIIAKDSYAVLDPGASPNAMRQRLHTARNAFKRFLENKYPDWDDLKLDLDSLTDVENG